MSAEAGQTFWVCSVAYGKNMRPGERLAEAIELAGERLGHEPAGEIRVHPETAAETPPREGVELVAHAGIGRFDYWFPRNSLAAAN